VELQQVLGQAERLIHTGRPQEAVDLLEPLLATYPRIADLHFTLGTARVNAGNRWGGLASFERGLELSDNPAYRMGVAALYMELELHGFALPAFRQALKQRPDHPMMADVPGMIAWLEERVQIMAGHLQVTAPQAEKGLYILNQGQRALHLGDYSASIAANRQAIKLLPNWIPPYNNLSLAQFYGGQPDAAVATARQVLAKEPHNIQALSNAIRFLCWTGQAAEARALWSQLQPLTPQDETERLKMSEAAAVLEEDEIVYQVLKPLDRTGSAAENLLQPSEHVQLFLAVAEANTGRRGARRRLEQLIRQTPWIDRLLAALKAKKPGPGWAERYPYFPSNELITPHGIEAFVKLLGYKEKWSPTRFRREMDAFLTRYPQIVPVAEKLIWEEEQPALGFTMLETIGTPAAYAVLRRFGLSQAGDDEARMQALLILLEAGQITSGERLRIWNKGRWQEVQLRQQIVSDRPREANPRVVKLMRRALDAFQKKEDQKAERLFHEILALDPNAKEAYNNLGSIYAYRGEAGRAKEMFQKALELDPLYVFPRCNLALYLLDDDDVEGAEAMIAPLAEVTQFHPQEMAFYTYLQARLLIRRKEYQAARQALQTALEIWPDYGPAQEMLENLDQYARLEEGYNKFYERQQQQRQARRAKLQAQLTDEAPTLAEVIALYPKEVLVGMAREVIPWGGWSGMRKAALVQHIVEVLNQPERLKQLVDGLKDNERAALRQVLAGGGSLTWSTFDAAYDNDLEESPYWQWHTPETLMGRLRERGLLAEATVAGELRVVIPAELRPHLAEILE
jgi:tetratricopeptide (TPR) repeat protein